MQVVMSTCVTVSVIWTDIEPESIGRCMFLSVLPTGPKDFKNSGDVLLVKQNFSELKRLTNNAKIRSSVKFLLIRQ